MTFLSRCEFRLRVNMLRQTMQVEWMNKASPPSQSDSVQRKAMCPITKVASSNPGSIPYQPRDWTRQEEISLMNLGCCIAYPWVHEKQWSRVANSAGSGAELSRFKSYLCCLEATWLCASHLISLSLSFLIFKFGKDNSTESLGLCELNPVKNFEKSLAHCTIQ